jgi:propanol-preferring alcohol dehydrogenase
MKVAVLRRYGDPLVIEEWPDPEPVGEQVVVRVDAAGMCHTDLHLMHWRNRELPLVLGHEIAGHADGIGPVLVHQSWGCGRCPLCLRGDEQLCLDVAEAGFERPGGYAERVLVPSPKYLLPLDGLSPQRAAPLTDAGATAYRAVRRAAPFLPAGSRAVLIGVGALGQFGVQFLRLLTDAEVIAVDVSADKLARAVELGAHQALPAAELTGPATAVLDFVCEPDTLALAARLVQPGGLIMRIGSGEGWLKFGRGVVPPEVTFTSARGGSRADVAAVLEHARRGELRWDVETLPLERANEGLDRLRRGEVTGRLVLIPGGPA